MQPQSQPSPLNPDQLLPSQWTIFEGYNAKDYNNSKPQKVISFKSASELIEIFSNLPHFKPTMLFSQLTTQTDSYSKLFPTLQNPQIQLPIDNIFIFRNEIYPEWEDAKNKDGSILHFIVKDLDKLDVCWSQLCCMLVSENLGNWEIINGIRLMEKMQQNIREFRIQIWFAKNYSGPNVSDENFLNVLGAVKMMFNFNQAAFEEKGIYANKKQ